MTSELPLYRDVYITIDGQPICVDATVTVEKTPVPDGPPLACSSGTYEISMSNVLPSRSMERLLGLLHEPGVGTAELVRRASYGGRKGRGAIRRLMALGWSRDYAITCAIVARLVRRGNFEAGEETET